MFSAGRVFDADLEILYVSFSASVAMRCISSFRSFPIPVSTLFPIDCNHGTRTTTKLASTLSKEVARTPCKSNDR